MTPELNEHVFVDVNNVHFVDAVQTASGQFNFLFRGPNPLTADPPYTLNYHGLCDAIENAAATARAPLTKPYRLVDINLMQWGNANEVAMILAEHNFFRDYPELGEFHFWETNGTGLCPLEPPLNNPAVQQYLATNLASWLGDELADQADQSGRMQQLRSWLEAENDMPNVIYAHCEGGIDRTGELMGAYYLRWMGKSWAEINQLNFEIANRAFGCNNFRATLWYCIYLVEVMQFKLDYSQAFKCYDWGDPPDGHYGCSAAPA